QWQITPAVNAYFSVLDLGEIHWDDGTRYLKKEIKTLQGLDLIDQLINNEDYSLLDTIYSIVTLDKTEAVYNTPLIAESYAGFVVETPSNLRLGANVSFQRLSKDFNLTSISAHALQGFGKLELGGSVSWQNLTILNVGVLGRYTYKNWSLFAQTDHLSSVLFPNSAKTIVGRAGLIYQTVLK